MIDWLVGCFTSWMTQSSYIFNACIPSGNGVPPAESVDFGLTGTGIKDDPKKADVAKSGMSEC